MKTLFKLLTVLLLCTASKVYAIDMDSYDNWRSTELCGAFGTNYHTGVATVSISLHSIAVTSASLGGTFAIHNATSVASYSSTSTLYNTNTNGVVWPYRTRVNKGLFLTLSGTVCIKALWEYTNSIPPGKSADGRY